MSHRTRSRTAGTVALVLACALLAAGIPPAGAAAHPLTAASPPATCTVSVAFSPKAGAASLVIRALTKAKKTAYIAIYGLNEPSIVAAIISAKGRGVEIPIKADKLQSAGKAQQAAIEQLRTAGVSVQIGKVPGGILHDKFVAVDGHLVVLGSFNWTNHAEQANRENVATLDCREIAELYEKEWAAIPVEGDAR